MTVIRACPGISARPLPASAAATRSESLAVTTPPGRAPTPAAAGRAVGPAMIRRRVAGEWEPLTIMIELDSE